MRCLVYVSACLLFLLADVAYSNITVNISSIEGVYTYIVGNRTDSPILIYYNTDPSVPLSDIKCNTSAATYNNPVNIYDVYLDEGRGRVELTCYYQTTVLHRIELDIQDNAAVTISYDGMTAAVYTNTYSYYPDGPAVRIPVLSQSISLSCNISTVRWSTQDSAAYAANPYTLGQFMTLNSADTYYAERMEGVDTTRAVDVNLVAVGTAIAIILSISDSVLLYNNSILEPITTGGLVCVTSYTATDAAHWYYQTSLNVSRIKPVLFEYVSYGLYFTLASHILGYHTCEVLDEQQNNISYVIGIFSADNITSYDFEQLPSTTYFTVGTDSDNISYIYVNTATDRELSGIIYTTDTGSEQYYHNPVRVHDVYTRVGRGSYVLTCYYQTSFPQIDILHTVNINIQDSAVLAVSYNDVVYQYTDRNNTMFPSIQTLYIPVYTGNITLSCSTSQCYWYWNSQFLESSSAITIPLMDVSYNGVYSYSRTNNFRLAAADISIIATGSIFAIKQSTTSYSLLPASSEITTPTSDITLACATDLTPVVSDSIQWYYTSTDAQNRIASTDSRLSLSTSTGISTLVVEINGTYICRVNVTAGSSFRTNEYTITISGPITSQATSIYYNTTTANQISTTIPATLQVTTVANTPSSLQYANITSSTVPATQQLTTSSSSVQSMYSISSTPSYGSDSTTITELASSKHSTSSSSSSSSIVECNCTSDNAVLIASLSIGLLIFMVLSVILGVLLITVSVYYYKAKNVLSAYNDIPTTKETTAQEPTGVRSDYEYMQVAGEDSRKYYQIPECPQRADYIDMNSVDDFNLKNDGSKYYIMEPRH